MTGKVFSGKTNEKIKRKVFYIHQVDKKSVKILRNFEKFEKNERGKREYNFKN